MIKNYLVVAWRNLWRNRLHTSINIFGLAVGVCACLVIYMIVSFELSFNRGHQGYDRIYRIHSSFKGIFSGLNRGVPTQVAPTMREQFTGIESVTFAHAYKGSVTIPNGATEKESEIATALIFTDSDFFQVFSAYEWIAGSPQVMEKPFQLVLTETSANKYFHTIDPDKVIGKEVIYQDSLSVTVAGIVKDLPFNTDIDFSDFISKETINQSWVKQDIQLDDWTSVNSSSQTFFKLSEGTTLDKIAAQLPLLSKLYKEKSQWDVENTFELQPLSDLHYNSDTGIFDHSRSPAHFPTLTSLIIVAILLLIIGAINFVNLETAQSIRRAKEVGVRKVLGSSKSKLVLQFLAESMIVTLIAVLLSLPLTEFSLQYFSEFIPKGVSLSLVQVFPFLVVVLIGIGVLAGLYPAFVMSSFLPAQALKNQINALGSSNSATFLRKILIVFQFTFAQILIIGTLIINSQVSFLLNKDLGFKKEAVIYLNTPWHESHDKSNVFKTKLEQIAEIENISLSESPPSYNGWSSSTISHFKNEEEQKTNAFRKFGDEQYIGFYGIELMAGRNLHKSDTAKEFLINETLLHNLGYENPQDILGQEIQYSKKKLPVVGVVKDFHIQSLHKKVEPVIMANEEKGYDCFNLKLATANDGTSKFTQGIEKIEKAWKDVYPDSEFHYEFLDETIKNFYQTEQRTAKLSDTATLLAILISCLGLFGLVSFTTIQRTKEIGIRKVMGASIESIVMLLSKDFVTLVIIAFIFATPAAYYAAKIWLEGFAYQNGINWLLFAATAIVAILIAFLTVSYKTFKAASSNPVDALRTE